MKLTASVILHSHLPMVVWNNDQSKYFERGHNSQQALVTLSIVSDDNHYIFFTLDNVQPIVVGHKHDQEGYQITSTLLSTSCTWCIRNPVASYLDRSLPNSHTGTGPSTSDYRMTFEGTHPGTVSDLVMRARLSARQLGVLSAKEVCGRVKGTADVGTERGLCIILVPRT